VCASVCVFVSTNCHGFGGMTVLGVTQPLSKVKVNVVPYSKLLYDSEADPGPWQSVCR